MNVQEALEKEAAIEKEVMKRWKALGAIISVGRFRNELLTDMLKAGAMVGGISFLIGLFFMYAEGRYDEFLIGGGGQSGGVHRLHLRVHRGHDCVRERIGARDKKTPARMGMIWIWKEPSGPLVARWEGDMRAFLIAMALARFSK